MSQPNPNNTDAILGGQNPPPVNAVILGGLAGAKQRLESGSIAERIQALNNGVNYGADGINLAIRSLTDDTSEVQRCAEKLLQYHFGKVGEKALLENISETRINCLYNPFLEFKQKIYNSEIGILDPENTAYIVKIHNLTANTFDMGNFVCLLKDPNVVNLRSLIFEINPLLDESISSTDSIVDVIFPLLTYKMIPNLKSLGIDYGCNTNTDKVDDLVVEQEIDDLFKLTRNRLIFRGVKYFTAKVLTLGRSEYWE